MVAHCIGLNHRATEAYLWEKLGRDFDYRSVLMEVGARADAYCAAHGVPVKPGLYPLLDYLDEKKLPYAVATSTHRENAERRLRNIRVWDRLSAVVTGDMVTNGKPDPEIFLRASELLDLPPSACMVLEDSPHGILAANKAGCLSVMIPDLQSPDRETRELLWAETDRLDHVIEMIEDVNT